MEDAEGGLSFDFEGGLEATAIPNAPLAAVGEVLSTTPSIATGPPAASVQVTAAQRSTQGSKRYFRQTVCRHWLRGLCMKGDVCGYLHQYDKARMPVCRFFAKYGKCGEPDCIYKHTNEDLKECNMYKLGFCPNGPDCRYRHQKMPGPFPSLEESLQKIQQRVTIVNGGHTGRYQTQQHGSNVLQEEGQPWQQSSAERNQGPSGPGADSQIEQQQRSQKSQQQQAVAVQNQAQSPLQQISTTELVSEPNFVSAASPLPEGYCRYFIVKSSNRENLELSVERGMWATHCNNEAKLNEAFDSCDHVILIFSVNETRHFQGCARMMSKIGGVVGRGGWKYAHGTGHYGRNFRLKWLKLCELSFNKTRHLRNPLNDNLPVKISRDCQELEPTVGEQLASLLYLEPDSDVMKVATEAEAKREEKAQGGGLAQETEDGTIDLFEENDEQDDDESDEDDSSSQTISTGQGRGRRGMGRGSTWGFQGAVGRGGMGMPRPKGMNFHMELSRGDGFSMGFDRFAMSTGDAHALPGDMFSAGARPGRGFPPYGRPGTMFGGQDFSNLRSGSAMGFGPIDGLVPAAGVFSHSRLPAPNGTFSHSGPGILGRPAAPLIAGPANIMGAGRPHFMGGPAAAGRPARPGGMLLRPPQSGGSGWGRRGSTDQQKRGINERNVGNERLLTGGDSRNTFKHRQRFSPTVETSGLDGETESLGLLPAQQQRDGSLFDNSMLVRNDDESDSEDEAPRRSRHGEGRKKKRDWEAEGASMGATWN